MKCGLYLHVPYCRSICPYCDFNVVRLASPPWPQLGRALTAELRARLPLVQGPLQSIYFGGGTPSLAPVGWLVQMLATVRAHVEILADAEITLELEPGTFGPAELNTLRAAGFNRISMGWQSTQDRLLKTLGRGHTSAESQAAFAAARTAGFDNISLDLIFAIPGQTEADLAADLEAVGAAAPDHVSAYNLTYHANTPFGRKRAHGLLQVVSDDGEVAMFDQVHAGLERMGYARYEVCSFARPNRRAVHNASYWDGTPYLGLGPGAHSFARNGWEAAWRWENVRKPNAYLSLWAGEAPSEHGTILPNTRPLPSAGDRSVTFVEALSPTERMLERVLLGLRTTDGVDFSEPALQAFAAQAEGGVQTLLRRGWATRQGAQLRPTSAGLRHADSAASLFV